MEEQIKSLQEQILNLNKAVQMLLEEDFVGTQTLLNLLIQKGIISIQEYQDASDRVRKRLAEDKVFEKEETE